MFKLRDISIRNKLILMQVFTSLLVLSIVFAVSVITDIRTYKERKANSVISLAQVIETNSISPLQFDDNEAAKNILSELRSTAPEITNAIILNKKGKIFASYSKTNTDSFHIPPNLSEKNHLYTDDHLYVSNPIMNNNEVVGKVFIKVELTELQELIKSKYQIGVVLLFVALGCSFLIAVFAQAYISKRLLLLVGTMKEVSRTGEYNKTISDKGNDEISTLIRVFNNLMQQIKENLRRKDEFIGIASHELKTPLTSIKGFVELLLELEDEEQKKEFLQKAMANSKRLDKLINDLLDVSKIQSGQQLELNEKEFEIGVLLDEATAAFQMAQGHEIIREDNLNGQTVIADRQRIEQVLTNLLSNAIKYSPPGSKVVINGRKTTTDLIIKVRDFGKGIPEEEQSNIFERFYRTKDNSIHVSGFGLGLYICRDIIERHQGKIWVESQEKGTAFYFSIPLRGIMSNQQNVGL